MWFPVEIHSKQAAASGLLDALAASLCGHLHHFVVADRRIDGRPVGQTVAAAADAVRLLGGCSVAYVGARHGAPIAPFAGFSLAPALGIAYLEYLIDYDPVPESGGFSRWLTSGLDAFVMFLRREHADIRTVVLPPGLGSGG